MHTERARHPIAHKRRDERRDERVVFDPPDDDDLQAEQRAGDGRPEDRREPSCHPGCEELPPRDGAEAKAVRDGVCNRTAHLDRRPFAAGAAAEDVREDRADEHHRRHAERDLLPAVVDRIDDEVVPPFDRRAPPLVDEADREAGEREGIDDRFVPFAERRRPLQSEEEESRGDTRRGSDERSEREPLSPSASAGELRGRCLHAISLVRRRVVGDQSWLSYGVRNAPLVGDHWLPVAAVLGGLHRHR